MLNIYIEATSLTEDRMSGIGHSILEITKALERLQGYGKEFKVILVTSYDTIEKLKRLKFTNVEYRKIPIPLRVLNILWKYDFLPPMDILYKRGVFIFPNYKNWRLLRSKSITYVHDIGFKLYPQYVAPKNQRFLSKNLPKWIERTSLVATDSLSAQNEISREFGVSDNKIQVIYHGVDKKVFYKRSTNEVSQVKNRYGITKGAYILYVGNIEPRKNITGLLEAYQKLPESLLETHQLVLVGGLGWLNEDIYNSISEAQNKGFKVNKVRKFVEDTDLPAIYSGASLLVLPSHYEGFGLSLVQAMACKIPVLAGNNSSMKEIVGNAGVLVDVNKTLEIRDGIVKILSDSKFSKNITSLAFEKVNNYSWDRSAADLLENCKKLLSVGQH